LVVILSAFLLFFGLGNRYLWQDEAESALLAKSILRTGLPIAFDGKNIVSQEMGNEFGPDFIWRWSPWVQFYIPAASFKIFQPTTLAARLPFALLGLLAVPLTYLLARCFFDRVEIARSSALVLATSVPFLLHARQCRWYAVAFVLICCLFLSFIAMARDKKWAIAGFAASGVFLFYTNFYVAIGVLIAVLVATPIYDSRKRFLVSMAVSFAITVIFATPGFFFFNSFAEGNKLDPERILRNSAFYSGDLFTFVCPLPVVVLLAYWLSSRRQPMWMEASWRKRILFLLSFCFLYAAYLTFGPWHFFRYLTVLLPIASILLGVSVFSIIDKSRIAGLAALAVLILTNAFHLVPLGLFQAPGTSSRSGDVASVWSVTFPLVAYLYEITHDLEDPEPAICRYLNEHADDNDIVLATYDDLPIQFYTDLHVIGSLQGSQSPDDPNWKDPDWIVPRQQEDRSWLGGREGSLFRALRKMQLKEKYDWIYPENDLGRRYSDFIWGNCPEPRAHCFKVPAEVPSILILRKRGR
jgi:hypothetical protein